jgi:hypothetical protein
MACADVVTASAVTSAHTFILTIYFISCSPVKLNGKTDQTAGQNARAGLCFVRKGCSESRCLLWILRESFGPQTRLVALFRGSLQIGDHFGM